MSKEEPSRGLLSRVVRFVRHPTAPWADAEASQDDRDSQYSKQMLKEMIERKRRNDFVRRREFDQLRSLRQRDALQGQRTDDDAALRASLLEVDSGLAGSSSDDRAGTIRKIDEIEAQMSQQWWRGAPLAGGGLVVLLGTAPRVHSLPGGHHPSIFPAAPFGDRYAAGPRVCADPSVPPFRAGAG